MRRSTIMRRSTAAGSTTAGGCCIAARPTTQTGSPSTIAVPATTSARRYPPSKPTGAASTSCWSTRSRLCGLVPRSRRRLRSARAGRRHGGARLLAARRGADQPGLRARRVVRLDLRAYLDFVLARRDLRYLTVDTDYGCGVVRKLKPRAAGFPPCRSRQSGGERARVAAWSGPGLHLATITAPPGACSRNRAELLNLITVAAFRAGAHALDN